MLNEIIKIIANDFIIIPVVLATVLFFRLKTREMKIKYVAVIVIAAVLALIFANIGRALVNNPRPFVVNPHLTARQRFSERSHTIKCTFGICDDSVFN